MILNNCDYYEFTSEGERQAKRSCKEKFDYKNMDELSKFLKNPNISGPLMYMCSTFQSYSMYIIALYSIVLVYSFWWAGGELPQCPRRVRSKHLVQRPRFETLFSIVSFLKNASDIKV